MRIAAGMPEASEKTNDWRRSLARAMVCGATLFAGGASATEELTIGGTGGALGAMKHLGAAFAKRNPDVKLTVVPSLGSGGGIKAAAQGALGLGLSSRPITEAERRSGLVEFEYARTPFVFAVSTRSKVTALTSAQIADLYAGRMQTWPDGLRTRPILRPVGDGLTAIIKAMSPEIASALTHAESVPGVPFELTDQDAASAIERTAGAFGASTLGQIKSEDRPLRALDLNGVAATAQNASLGRYPLYIPFFAVTRQAPPAAARRFIAFLRSPEGVEILARNGHWSP